MLNTAQANSPQAAQMREKMMMEQRMLAAQNAQPRPADEPVSPFAGIRIGG